MRTNRDAARRRASRDHELAGWWPEYADQLRSPRRRERGPAGHRQRRHRRRRRPAALASDGTRRRCACASRQRPGTHTGGRDIPRHQLCAAARSRQALHAFDGADGTDAGLHVLPACRHDPHRGPVRRHAGEGFTEPAQDLRLHAEDEPPRRPPARAESSRTLRRTGSAGQRRRPTSTS